MSLYLVDLLNIENEYFEQMVATIYLKELQLNKSTSNISNTLAPFLNLNLSISNVIISAKTFDKRDNFDFNIFRFLDSDVPLATSYGIHISQLIRFGRISSQVNDFNNLNRILTTKRFKQGYRYHKLRKTFS